MYCPNCGKTNSGDQKFCRSCGLRLEQVVQSLIAQLTARGADKNLVEKQRNLDRWIDVVVRTAMPVLVGAVIWGIIYSLIIVKGAVIGGSMFILGLILFTVLGLYRESLAKKSSRAQPPLTKVDTAKLLSEPHIESVPSVVERSSDLLTAEKKVNPTEQIKR